MINQLVAVGDGGLGDKWVVVVFDKESWQGCSAGQNGTGDDLKKKPETMIKFQCVFEKKRRYCSQFTPVSLRNSLYVNSGYNLYSYQISFKSVQQFLRD